jgi:hypothetical protein
MIDLDKFADLARAATPGPWTSDDGDFDDTPREDGIVGYDDMANVYGAPVEVGTAARPVQEVARLAYLPSNADAAFIAAANPQEILELVERMRAAENIVRDLAAKEPRIQAHDIFYPRCALCDAMVTEETYEASDGPHKIPHAESCPYRRAVEAPKP